MTGGKEEKGREINTKVSASPLPPGEQCQGNDVATTVSLIPMKITGWQGRLPHHPPSPRRQLQVIQARRRAAVVCGNCKLLLKKPRRVTLIKGYGDRLLLAISSRLLYLLPVGRCPRGVSPLLILAPLFCPPLPLPRLF